MTFPLSQGQSFLPHSLDNYAINPSYSPELPMLGYELLQSKNECSCPVYYAAAGLITDIESPRKAGENANQCDKC